MMRTGLLACTIMFIGLLPATAQELRVKTGEHGDFTRLVLPRPVGVEWSLLRNETGYVLSLASGGPGFDLSTAFDRIDRARISDLKQTEDGKLLLSIACACHAMPFEYRPDILVIDIRDGLPPASSSFELAADGSRLPPLQPMTDQGSPPPQSIAKGPANAPFDWTKDWLSRNRSNEAAEATVIRPDTSALRSALLQEFSRAVADGMIVPTDKLPEASDPLTRNSAPSSNLRVGDVLTTRSASRDDPVLTAEGGECPPEGDLAVEGWGDTRPPGVQLAEAMQNLVGEFDIPDPAAVETAVRLNLHLGFGAEAAQLLDLMPSATPQTAGLRSLSHIVDGQADPAGTFARFAACDGPVALWSALSNPPTLPEFLNKAAVIRSFSALPPHLRRSLGPPLVDAFLAADDLSSATTILDAILRIPGRPDARATVLAARLSLLTGANGDAEMQLKQILSDPGPDQATALVALVDLHASDARPMDAAVLPALAAYRTEREGTSDQMALGRAEILATALTGDFAAAFNAAQEDQEVMPRLWHILSKASDEAILTNAIGAEPALASNDARAAIADRLLSLGFAAEAERWSSSTKAPLSDPTSDPLGSALATRNWEDLPPDAAPVWRDAAGKLTPAEEAILSQPPLAQARALADESAQTRAALEDLLRSVALP